MRCSICLFAAESGEGIPRDPVRLGPLLPPDAGPDSLYGLVIPGYTLQCLDPATKAVPHSGMPAGLGRVVLYLRLQGTGVQPRAAMGLPLNLSYAC